ncbi:ClpXP protease specificity-enhancing factor [Marinobacterium sp. D7]|uniref:ClpXP protease specificity-enhancing factor n=1 Tax=Marinobacterium ramblicola TaxID=2849041 RepID=UPI001C2D263A|nr:ClpXP protease specificity-enhancing factor [Marinobacterium ramblicola]MBV1787071.1 ClpXP protease specificity-enhancing factor [Marinobacterium ramblicola]
MSVKPSRPYLLRALYEWLCDNDLTPLIVVDAGVKGVNVPEAYVQDGQITLNIALGAVRELEMDNGGVSFNARFGGVPMNVYVPITAVLAIYARENGMGMGFGMEPGADLLALAKAEQPEPEPPEPGPGGGRPSLRVVK